MTGQAFDSLSDLAAQGGGTEGAVVYVAYATVPDDRGGGQYRWSMTSTATPDGSNTIQVTGVSIGRWTRIKNNIYNSQLVSFQVVSLLTKAYVVTHGLPFTPSGVLLTPLTQAAGALGGGYWITNINATDFTINFQSLLVIGTASFVCVPIR